jgi:hypothetical protein
MPGAATVGRRHLLSPEALAEELVATSRRRSNAQADNAAPPTGSVTAELEREEALDSETE